MFVTPEKYLLGIANGRKDTEECYQNELARIFIPFFQKLDFYIGRNWKETPHTFVTSNGFTDDFLACFNVMICKNKYHDGKFFFAILSYKSWIA